KPITRLSGADELLRNGALVVVIAHPFGYLVMPPNTAAIFRRAGIPAGDATRPLRSNIKHLLYTQHVLPAVAKIIVVPEPITDLRDKLIETHTLLCEPLLTFLNFKLREKHGSWVFIACAKGMQMTILPPHNCLEEGVKMRECRVAGYIK